jgi:hypothetical protein
MHYISVNEAAEYGARQMTVACEKQRQYERQSIATLKIRISGANNAAFIPRIPPVRVQPLVPVAKFHSSRRTRYAPTRREKAALLLEAAGTLVGRLFRRRDTGPETR